MYMEYEKEAENIFDTVEQTNTELVANNLEHLDVIVEALMYGVGANLRMMAENDPTLLRELADFALERMAKVLEQSVEFSEADSNNRIIN